MSVVGFTGVDSWETASYVMSTQDYTLVAPRAGAQGSAVRVTSTSARLRINRSTALTADAIWMHFGFWMRNDSLGTAIQNIVGLFNGTNNTSITLGTTSDGRLTVARSNATLGTTAALAADGNWHHVHVSTRLSTVATTGRAKVWVDGVLDLDVTAQTVAVSTDRGFSYLSMWSSLVGGSVEFDDVWVDDDNTEWMAPKPFTVTTLRPDGPGASAQWTPSPGYANWQAVGDASDATTVTSQTTGVRDLYTFADLPAASTSVAAVALHTRGQQVGAGTPTVKALHRHSTGVVTAGAGIGQGAAMNSNAPALWETNPATGSAWTVADVNDAQFGVELA